MLQYKLREMTDCLWLRLSNQSIFITGGTGLFGRWLVESMCEANQRLGANIRATILTRNIGNIMSRAKKTYHDPAITLIQGDVSDFEFPNEKFSKIIHMAATSAQETFNGADQLAKFQMLVNGTEHVLQLATECEAEKVLLTSSGVVYGSYSTINNRVSETCCSAPGTTDPLSALGEGKRVSELLCGYYSNKYKFDYVVARCFSFAGPGIPLNMHYAIGNLIYDAIERKELVVRGNGSPIRSYLYLGDLLVWLLTLLLDGESERIYNVGSDVEISIKKLAYKVRDLLSPLKNVKISGSELCMSEHSSPDCYVPDIERARKDLNLAVWTPLDEIILNTAKFYYPHHVQAESERTHQYADI